MCHTKWLSQAQQGAHSSLPLRFRTADAVSCHLQGSRQCLSPWKTLLPGSCRPGCALRLPRRSAALRTVPGLPSSPGQQGAQQASSTEQESLQVRLVA